MIIWSIGIQINNSNHARILKIRKNKTIQIAETIASEGENKRKRKLENIWTIGEKRENCRL